MKNIFLRGIKNAIKIGRNDNEITEIRAYQAKDGKYYTSEADALDANTICDLMKLINQAVKLPDPSYTHIGTIDVRHVESLLRRLITNHELTNKVGEALCKRAMFGKLSS